MGKVDVKGDSASAIHKNLKAQAPDNEITWNFAKYLLNGQGQVIKFVAHGVDPNDMMPDIEALLNQQ